MGCVRLAAAMLAHLGLPADMSFGPYSSALVRRGQMLEGLSVVHSAPAGRRIDSEPQQLVLAVCEPSMTSYAE